MEHKKTFVATILTAILIVLLIVVSYFYYNFNTEQIVLLTREANKILESNLAEDNIDFEIKTDKNYAEVEKAMKEYISKLKSIYVEMEEIVSGIHPNTIFSIQNIPEDKNLKGIEDIISQYKEKSQKLIENYQELVKEEQITENINNIEISTRKDYFVNLYNEVMFSETMQNKYSELDEEIKNQKGKLYEKLNKIEKIKLFLEENQDSWIIKEDKIQIINSNKITEYYSLVNQVLD